MTRKMRILLCALAVLACSSTVPANAAELSASPAATLETAPAPSGCGETLDLALLAPEGGMCPAEAPSLSPVPASPPFKLRTCVCSCGYPCKTDADCGPGGRCGPGITCC
jgi:hypothetical protein